MLIGGAGDDILRGGGGSDTLDGGDGQDKLYGGSGSNSLTGGAGNDILDGSGGNDSLSGGSADDRIVQDDLSGNDTIDGDAEIDTVDYSGLTATGANIAVALAAGTVVRCCAGVAYGAGVIRNTEVFIGTGNNDTITGSSGDDVFKGGAGNDFAFIGSRPSRVPCAPDLNSGVTLLSAMQSVLDDAGLRNLAGRD